MNTKVVKENLEMNIRWIERLPACQFHGYGNVVTAMQDALRLLKEYEPSLMTLEDVLAWAETKADERNPIFFESKAGESAWICRPTCPKDYYLECLDGKARCWTWRPTDEQRKATPWRKEESMLSDIYQAASDELDRVKNDTVMLDQIDKTDDLIGK